MGGLAAIPLLLIAILPLGLASRGLRRKQWALVFWCLLALLVLAWMIWRLMSGRQD